MRSLILYAAFLSAVAGYQNAAGYREANSSPASSSSATTTTTEKLDLITTTQQNVASANTSKAPDTTAANLLPALISELPTSLTSEDSKRRYITYDQRQEGQYNIRADLENFMIILIPPSPADGLNLLDLLTKATYRRSAQATSKGKKKHYMSTTSLQPEAVRLHQTLKSGGIHNINYLAPGENGDNLASGSSNSVGEYIEGRTPYQVDISSSVSDEVGQARMHGDRQVDVLPPPYPLAYQQLIKPYHLEAESTLIQALPPAELSQQKKQSAGNYLEAYNQIVAPKTPANADNINKNFLIPPADINTSNSPATYFRLARAIRGDNTYLDTNRVTSSYNLPLSPSSSSSSLSSTYTDRLMMARRSHTLPLYRADLSLGAAQLYPPLDVPHYSSYLTLNGRHRGGGSGSDFKHLNDDKESDGNQSLSSDLMAGEIFVPSSNLEDDFELNLHAGGIGNSYIDAEAKTLLSDGIERCAPGKRRDSYGVCRQIGGY